MDRAPITVFNSTIKACADCAHLEGSRCTAVPLTTDLVSGKAEHLYAAAARTEGGGCGQSGIKFHPKPGKEARRNEQRRQLQLAIEESIVKLHPDATEAQEILDAISAALESRFEHRAEETQHYLKRSRECLDTVEDLEIAPVAKS